MAIKPSTNNTSADIIINNYLNTAYDTVKEVADNLDMLTSIYNSLTELQNIEDLSEELSAIYDALASLEVINTNLTALLAINTNITELLVIESNITELLSIQTNITSLLAINTNLTALLSISTNLTSLLTINTNMTELLVIETNIDALLTIESNIAELLVLYDLLATGTITSTGPIVISADSDASGIDGIDLKTRGTTQLKIENDGNTNHNGNELLESKTILDQQIAPYYHFDGTTNKITLLTNDQLNFNYTDFSILVEFSFKSLDATSMIVDKRAGSGNGYQIYGVSTGTLNCSVDFGSSYILSSDEVISLNTRHVAIMRVDRDGNLSMVIDGVIQSNVIDISGSYGNSMFTSQDLILGLSELAVSPFNGDLSRIVMFNRLLTDDEAISLSSNPLKAIDWEDESGSNIDLSETVFANSATPYTTFSSATADGFIGGSDGVGAQYASKADYSVISGYKYRIIIDLDLTSGDAPRALLRNSAPVAGATIYSPGVLSDGINIFEFISDTTDTTAFLWIYNVSGEVSSFEILSTDIIRLGATLILNPQDITKDFWFDSAIGANNGAVTGAEVGNKSRQLYEEKGTWTPTIYGETTPGTYTASISENSVYKCGSIVKLTANISNITASSGGTGILAIGGLPYTNHSSRTFGVIQYDNLDLPAGSITVVPIISANEDIINIRISYDNASDTALDISSISSGVTDIFINIEYLTND